MVNSTGGHPYQQEPTALDAVTLANGIEVRVNIPAHPGGSLTAEITLDATHSAGERLLAAHAALREHAGGQLQISAPTLSDDQSVERHVGFPVDATFG